MKFIEERFLSLITRETVEKMFKNSLEVPLEVEGMRFVFDNFLSDVLPKDDCYVGLACVIETYPSAIVLLEDDVADLVLKNMCEFNEANLEEK